MTASELPSTTARVMQNSTYRLHTKDADEPSATSVSMFGARWNRDLKPLMKNFWLMTITSADSTSCTSPMATWLPSNHLGSGQPHIMCPMEKYISGISRQSDAISRLFKTGVSRSLRASSSAATAEGAPSFPFRDAP